MTTYKLHPENDVLFSPAVMNAFDLIDLERLKNNPLGIEVKPDYLKRDQFPIPVAKNREGYYAGHDLDYWLSGYSDYSKIIEAAQKHAIVNGRYFDFGGSTGRVFRHFITQSDKWEVWSSDFKSSSVQWNRKYFNDSARFIENSALPALDLPDNYFDIVSAFSVFTHIDEEELGWLVELRRILKKGGIAYLTFHDDYSWQELQYQIRQLKSHLADKPMPDGKTSIKFRLDMPYSVNVFHSENYIRKVWGSVFNIEEMVPKSSGYQAVVVACK